MGDTILIRRGTAANLPDLQEGEPGFSTDNKGVYVGDSTGTAESASYIGGGVYVDALQHEPNTFTQATIEAALTAIGTSNKVTLLIRPGTWPIISNADWSAYKNVMFKIVPGAVISRGAFTLNIPQIDTNGFHQRFSGTGLVTLGKTDVLRPEFFGAPANQVNDDHVAVQQTVDCALASKIQTIRFDGIYYFTDYVEISAQYADLRLTGSAMAGWIAATPKQSEITGINGLSTLFLLSANPFALEVDHIRFRGNNVTTGVGSAFKSTSEAWPSRPLNIHHNHFTGFAKAIYSYLTAGGANTGIAQVNIENNTFFGNTYALYGDGDLNAIMNLRFVGNVSEQGGKIGIADTGLGGTFTITDNLFEGQADAVKLSSGHANGEFARNYFEANTGYILQYTATTGGSLRIGENFYSGCAGAIISVINCDLFNYDDLLGNGILLHASFLGKKSRIGQNSIAPLGGNTQNAFDISTVSRFTSPTSGESGKVSPNLIGDGLVSTPMGIRAWKRVGVGSYSFASSLSIGDYVVFNFLVRANAGGPLYLQLRNDADVLIVNSETSFTGGLVIGEWSFIHITLKATAISTGIFKYSWQNLADLDVADGWITVTSGVGIGGQVRVFLPRLGGSGKATITNPATTVVVTHALGYTPYMVTATPINETMGSVFVSAIGATTFTINVSAAPAGTGYISWTAN